MRQQARDLQAIAVRAQRTRLHLFVAIRDLWWRNRSVHLRAIRGPIRHEQDSIHHASRALPQRIARHQYLLDKQATDCRAGANRETGGCRTDCAAYCSYEKAKAFRSGTISVLKDGL